MRKLMMLGGAVATILTGGEAAGQSPVAFAVEGRGGVALPVREWGEGLGTGFGFGANAQASLGVVGVYAGWERFTFALDDDQLGEVEGDAADTGFRAGLIVTLPNRAAAVSPFLSGGVTYNQTSFTFGDGEGATELESGRGVGVEGAIGVNIPLGPTVSFTPAGRFRSRSATFASLGGVGDDSSSVQYLVVDLGLRFALGN